MEEKIGCCGGGGGGREKVLRKDRGKPHYTTKKTCRISASSHYGKNKKKKGSQPGDKLSKKKDETETSAIF